MFVRKSSSEVSQNFASVRVGKCSKILPNIILGLMEAIGCFHAKIFFRSSVPRNNAFGYRNASVSQRFACTRVAKRLWYAPKHHFGSNGGYWVCLCKNIRQNFGTTKQCLHVPKRTSFSSFCMSSGREMLQNTPKHHFGSNGDYSPKYYYGSTQGYWVCSRENFDRNFGAPKPCIRVTKRTSLSSVWVHSGSESLQNTPKYC